MGGKRSRIPSLLTADILPRRVQGRRYKLSRVPQEIIDRFDRFVAVDVEIAGRTPVRVCAIGAACFEAGVEIDHFESLVCVKGPIHYTGIHGLAASDLRGAPLWPTVWGSFCRFLRDVNLLVAFRAEFDRGAILTMCGRDGIRVPRMHFECAASVVKAQFGWSLGLSESIARLGLPFPGRPHDPLSDARAAAAIVMECTRRRAAAIGG